MATARDALKGMLQDKEHPDFELLRMALGDAEERSNLEMARVVSEAHVLGAVFASRALMETFGQLANLLLLSPKLPERDCTYRKVTGRLPETPLKLEMEKQLRAGETIYISDLFNASKHRRLMNHSISASYVDNVSGMRVSEFEYEQRSHPKKWAVDVLQEAIVVKNGVIACGNLLNSEVVPDAA